MEEKIIKGLPLGGIEDFKYVQEKFTVDTGDIILLMTDGFSEIFNPQGETLDLKRIKELFMDNADKEPEQLIQQFNRFGENWSAGRPQNDAVP